MNEPGGQVKFGAPERFAAGHFTVIGFMVHAKEMECAMEHENHDLLFDGVAELGGLLAGALEGDGEFVGTGEGKDVGGGILTAELEVEAAEFGIAGEQAGEIQAKAIGESLGEGLDGRSIESGGDAPEGDKWIGWSHGEALGVELAGRDRGGFYGWDIGQPER